LAPHFALYALIQAVMALPCAVEPEERSSPVAHLKPAASKVAPVAAPELGALPELLGISEPLELLDISELLAVSEPLDISELLAVSEPLDISELLAVSEPLDICEPLDISELLAVSEPLDEVIASEVAESTADETAPAALVAADEAGAALFEPHAVRTRAAAAAVAARPLIRVIFTLVPPGVCQQGPIGCAGR